MSSRMRSQPQLRNDKYITVSLHLAYCCTATAHCSTYSYLRNLVSWSLKRWFLICETLRYLKLCPFRHQVHFIRSLQYLPLLTPFYALKNPHYYISAGVFIVKTNSSLTYLIYSTCRTAEICVMTNNSHSTRYFHYKKALDKVIFFSLP